jgi:hypothetical protein
MVWRMTEELPQDLLELLERPSICFLASLMPGGATHLTQTWVDTDGTRDRITRAGG